MILKVRVREIGQASWQARGRQLQIMSGREAQLLKRHAEIRSALRFFLNSWYKHKQAGTVPDKQRVLFDYIRFRSLDVVLKELRTKAAPPSSNSSIKP